MSPTTYKQLTHRIELRSYAISPRTITKASFFSRKGDEEQKQWQRTFCSPPQSRSGRLTQDGTCIWAVGYKIAVSMKVKHYLSTITRVTLTKVPIPLDSNGNRILPSARRSELLCTCFVTPFLPE